MGLHFVPYSLDKEPQPFLVKYGEMYQYVRFEVKVICGGFHPWSKGKEFKAGQWNNVAICMSAFSV